MDNTGKTMEIVVSEHLCRSLPERLEQHRGAVIVADPATRAAVGEDIFLHLVEAMRATVHMLPFSPKPQQSIALSIPEAPSMLAIGSGTINDLVKFAAHTRHVPYAVIATAPSMNGYTSSTASLIENGHKQSLQATAPIAVYADTHVLAHAPTRMIAAGVGDTLCRSTVEADWRLAHIRGKAQYEDAIMAPLREAEHALLPHTARLKARDTGTIALLWDALIAGGNAMRTHGSSMPASQGEHMIAHAMEATYGHNGSLHGEDIAVATLTMVRLQEMLKPMLRRDAQWITEHSIAPETLQKALADAGCPLTPEAIGWDKEAYKTTVNNAWKTRDRYGFLAFAAELGVEPFA